MFDQFSYGYLGYQLGPDGQTIYYLTGAPVFIDGKRVQGAEEIAKGAASGLENLHLVTYHIPERKYTDHGPVFYPNYGRHNYVNSDRQSVVSGKFVAIRADLGGRSIIKRKKKKKY